MLCAERPSQAQAPTPTPHRVPGSLEPAQLYLPEGLQQDTELLSTAQRKHRDQHLWGTREELGREPPAAPHTQLKAT